MDLNLFLFDIPNPTVWVWLAPLLTALAGAVVGSLLTVFAQVARESWRQRQLWKRLTPTIVEGTGSVVIHNRGGSTLKSAEPTIVLRVARDCLSPDDEKWFRVSHKRGFVAFDEYGNRADIEDGRLPWAKFSLPMSRNTINLHAGESAMVHVCRVVRISKFYSPGFNQDIKAHFHKGDTWGIEFPGDFGYSGDIGPATTRCLVLGSQVPIGGLLLQGELRMYSDSTNGKIWPLTIRWTQSNPERIELAVEAGKKI